MIAKQTNHNEITVQLDTGKSFTLRTGDEVTVYIELPTGESIALDWFYEYEPDVDGPDFQILLWDRESDDPFARMKVAEATMDFSVGAKLSNGIPVTTDLHVFYPKR